MVAGAHLRGTLGGAGPVLGGTCTPGTPDRRSARPQSERMTRRKSLQRPGLVVGAVLGQDAEE